MIVPVPKPQPDPISIVIEEAFNALYSTAELYEIKLKPVDGLEYLPNLELIKNFKEACRDILEAQKDA